MSSTQVPGRAPSAAGSALSPPSERGTVCPEGRGGTGRNRRRGDREGPGPLRGGGPSPCRSAMGLGRELLGRPAVTSRPSPSSLSSRPAAPPLVSSVPPPSPAPSPSGDTGEAEGPQSVDSLAAGGRAQGGLLWAFGDAFPNAFGGTRRLVGEQPLWEALARRSEAPSCSSTASQAAPGLPPLRGGSAAAGAGAS